MRTERPRPTPLALRLPRRRLLALAGAGAALALAGRHAWGVAAAEQPALQVLPNGLVVIVEERNSADTVALQHTALAGVRDDGDIPGVTVLTSRMLLAGTQRRPSDIAMRRAASLAGGTLSRGTLSESSSIASVMPADSAELAFDLISDALSNPLFSADSLHAQQVLALQGIAQRRSDASTLLGDLLQQTLFAGRPLGYPPLGSPDNINSLTVDAITATWQRLWGAANGVLTIAGRIDAGDAFNLASQYFGPLFAGSANNRPPTQAQAPRSAQTVQSTAGDEQLFRIGFLAPSIPNPDRYPMAVLTEMMGGFAGRLLRELRTKRALSFAPDAAFQSFSDAGFWYAGADLDPANLDEALSVTKTEIQRLSDEQAGADEVSGAIDSIAGQEILASEANDAVASQLAAQQIFGDVSTDEFVRRVRAVTPDDVQRVARAYLQLDHALTVLVGPAGS